MRCIVIAVGLRLYGRAWGKIYRMVGPVKTATQCKSFFDDYRDDPNLQLHKALSEHNIIKVGCVLHITCYLFELLLNIFIVIDRYRFITYVIFLLY